MVKSLTGQKGTTYRWEDVARPWNSIDSPNKQKEEDIRFGDPEDQVAICLSCTRKKCTGGEKCTRRLGKPAKKRGRPPKKEGSQC